MPLQLCCSFLPVFLLGMAAYFSGMPSSKPLVNSLLPASGRETRLVMLQEEEFPFARCLDGSMAGFYRRQGNVAKTIIWLEGGGWCYAEDCDHVTNESTLENCRSRAKTDLGSSAGWSRRGDEWFATGDLSSDCTENPVFCEWTVIAVPYCDGAGFAGNAEVDGLHFRGKAILQAVLAEAIRMGLRESSQVVFSGGSAGALAVLHFADEVRDIINLTAGEVVAIPDAGFFLDVPDVANKPCWQEQMRSIYTIAAACPNLQKACVRRHPTDPCRCIYPEYYADLVETRTFLVQSLYDTSELWYTLRLPCCPPGLCEHSRWETCTDGSVEMQRFTALREQHIRAWKPLVRRKGNGAWSIACLEHTMMWKWFTSRWYQVPGESGRTIAQAVHKWLERTDWANHSENMDVWEDVAWPHNKDCAYYM
mmetsp:Transcript_2525/g.6370  ORF Transcript_2525/g.6370 Transcript_2525/m.6370 type:complete len:422 (+) Transcript_2525:137-1402(+)